MMMKIALVMPTMRDAKSLEKFIEIAPDNVDFIIISKEKMTKKYDRVTEFMDDEVFKKSWIFNRITKRNFGFLYAYKQNYDIILSLDDDCYPLSNSFFEDHVKNLQSYDTNYFNTLELFSNIPENVFKKGARGYPTKDPVKKYPVVINQGMWHGDLDLPAKTIFDLKGDDGKVPQPISTDAHLQRSYVIPNGKLTTVCVMNLSFQKEAVPIVPVTYQDPDGVGISRYDDIWSGLFAKKILDTIDKRMTAGFPAISHNKAPRDIQNDILYEENGDFINSFLWKELLELKLESKDYVSCFQEISDWLKIKSDDQKTKFLEKISNSMNEWIKFF
jgi:hypothetical protein